MRRAWLLLPLLLLAAAPAASYCDGRAYLARGTQLLRFDPVTGGVEVWRELPGHVNALAVRDGELYAIARPGARPVKLTPDGAMAELGPIRGGPPGGFSGAFVGTSSGDSWLLMHDDRVYVVALDTLTVTAEAPLSRPVRIGDWAAAGGRLLSLSTDGPRASLIQIDPGSGVVEVLAYPQGLPSGSLFGAVWVLGGSLYGWHHVSGTIHRVDLADAAVAHVVATGLAGDSVDGAACERVPIMPPGLVPSAAPVVVVGQGVTTTTFAPEAPRQVPARGPALGPVTVVPPARVAVPPPPAGPADRALAGFHRVPEKEQSVRRWIAAGAGAMTLALVMAIRGGAARGRR